MKSKKSSDSAEIETENTRNFDTKCQEVLNRILEISDLLIHIRSNGNEIFNLLNDESFVLRQNSPDIVFFLSEDKTSQILLKEYIFAHQQVMSPELQSEYDHVFLKLINKDPESKSKEINPTLLFNFFKQHPDVLEFFDKNLQKLINIQLAYKNFKGLFNDRGTIERELICRLTLDLDNNQRAIKNLIAVIRNEKNVTLSEEALEYLKTPQALYAIAHVANRTFYLSLIPKEIRTPILKSLILYRELVSSIRGKENSDNSEIVSKFKKIHGALDDIFYGKKVDPNIINEIVAIPAFQIKRYYQGCPSQKKALIHPKTQKVLQTMPFSLHQKNLWKLYPMSL